MWARPPFSFLAITGLDWFSGCLSGRQRKFFPQSRCRIPPPGLAARTFRFHGKLTTQQRFSTRVRARLVTNSSPPQRRERWSEVTRTSSTNHPPPQPTPRAAGGWGRFKKKKIIFGG